MSKVDIESLMREVSTDALEYAKANFGVNLDWTEDSIALIDDILSQLDIDELSEQDIFTISYIFGAYVGEVFIRNQGGKWVFHEESENEPPQTFIVKGDISIAFPGKVYKALDSSESIRDYYNKLI